jgi:hypothetical protein
LHSTSHADDELTITTPDLRRMIIQLTEPASRSPNAIEQQPSCQALIAAPEMI